MQRFLFILMVMLVPLPLAAQTDDRGYLTAFLEDNLSGAGRVVTVTGFEGALSSQARIAELTIADDQGIWLTLRDVVLDWNRAALFSGQVSINALTAAEIRLDRLPTTTAAAGPTPEAGNFSLPELPVSVDIGKIAAAHIVLGQAVLGSALEGSLEAALDLSGGEGTASLLLERTDQGPAGRVALTAGYANATGLLHIDLTAQESAGGVAVGLLGLPGAPAIRLAVQGDGPVSAFAAKLALSTDGVDRLAGQITLTGQADGATGFAADLGGDLAPLFVPDYAAFFGPKVALAVTGARWPDGRLDLTRMDVSARALRLSGSLALAADGLPRRLDLTGQIRSAEGDPVLLPLATALPVHVTGADLALRYDATQDEGWTGRITLTKLDRADFRAGSLALAGSGRIARHGGARQIGGTFAIDASGLAPQDPALAAALGSRLNGQVLAYWREGDGALSVPRLSVTGDGFTASAGGRVQGLGAALGLVGHLGANIADLSRLSQLTGQDLGGAATLDLAGSASPLTGAFDITGTARGQDMRLGLAPLDHLLTGPAQIDLSAQRDTTGTRLRQLKIAAASLRADASGTIASTGSDIRADLAFDDLSALGPGYRGRLAGQAQMAGTLTSGKITLAATATDLGLGQAEADRLLAGESRLAVDLALKDGGLSVTRAELANPQLQATASGSLQGGAQKLDLTARLANLALLLPDFPGALTVGGVALQSAKGLTLDLAGKGPGQIDASLKGRIAPGFGSADLVIRGTALAALANPFLAPRAIAGRLGFDLRLSGPLTLAALSGPVTLSDGRLADPTLPFALQGIEGKADLAGGRAKLALRAGISTGGQVRLDGSVGLTAPFTGDLALDLASVTLRDPELYDTTLNGKLQVKGPLLGGALISGPIALGETELRVPSTGFGGPGALPGLAHVNESAASRATRARAGLIARDGKGSGGGAGYALDIALSAPNRVFVRGRGLDAELGGELRLRGTTKAVAPAGSFDLLRGRLDILGKRLDLTDGLLQMEGQLVPRVHIVASTTNDGITSAVQIDGPATDPEVSFTSTPPLPEEEILAQLLFGQGLQNLSALQALQLAGAVATLAGKGGEGVVGRLRRGFGLDNLDVKTDATGGTSLTAGKYIGKHVYTEVTVDQTGQSQINLNLDISKSLTLRGRAVSDGSTGFGVVLEKDY